MSVFKIRYLTPKCLEIHQAIVSAFSGGGSGRARAQVSNIEVESSLVIDPKGIIVGELDGKPMSFASVLRYDNTYCHAGFCYVEPKYRGSSYGDKLFSTALKRVLPSHIISGYAQDYVMNFKSRFPTYHHWKLHVFDFDLHSAYQRVNKLSSSSLYIAIPVDEVDKQSLAQYDASVFGYHRHAFLEQWLAAKGGHATVAVTNQGEIVGYAASRVPCVQDITNFWIGPLFANSIETATVLLRSLFEEMLKKEEQNSSLFKAVTVRIGLPGDINSEGTELFEFLGGKVAYKSNYFSISTTGELPKGRFNNWYGITSVLIG